MIKTFSVAKEMHIHTGRARVSDFEDEAVHALIDRKIMPGDVLVIRYEGPRASRPRLSRVARSRWSTRGT